MAQSLERTGTLVTAQTRGRGHRLGLVGVQVVEILIEVGRVPKVFVDLLFKLDVFGKRSLCGLEGVSPVQT